MKNLFGTTAGLEIFYGGERPWHDKLDTLVWRVFYSNVDPRTHFWLTEQIQQLSLLPIILLNLNPCLSQWLCTVHDSFDCLSVYLFCFKFIAIFLKNAAR